MESCLIIGGEIAATRAAHDLLALGIPVIMINFSEELCKVSKMLQRGDNGFSHKKNGQIPYLIELESNPQLTLINNIERVKIIQKDSPFEIAVEYNDTTRTFLTETVILATGFKPFDIKKLEEYGYGVLDGVITLFDLEKSLQNNKLPFNENIERIIFILCAGSRISRGNPDCSTYCCNHSINQALFIKKMYPQIEVILMYMDIRTVANQEFLYNEARKAGIIFVRGRPSSIERLNDKLVTFVEDTLSEEQKFMTADFVVLAVGSQPFPGSDELALNFNIQLNHNNFIKVVQKPVTTSVPGIFTCGSACDGIKNIQQSFAEGGAAAMAVVKFLKRN